MRILNINARYPGSTHDSYIWGCSVISAFLEETVEENTYQYCLLGDSGYPLQPWLLTPIQNERTAGEKKFNKKHKKLRSLVERAIGYLKNRFRYYFFIINEIKI